MTGRREPARIVLGVSGGIAAYKAVEVCRRLELRGADDPEAIERRLARAEAEEEIARERFDAVIVNDDVDRAAAELAAIVEARRQGER